MNSSTSNPVEQLRQLFPQLPDIAIAILQAVHDANQAHNNASNSCNATNNSSSSSSSDTSSQSTTTPAAAAAPQVRHFAICDNCRRPIVGVRYKCVNCADFDLCSQCESSNTDGQAHDSSHVFLKLTRPMINRFRRSEPLIDQILVAGGQSSNNSSNASASANTNAGNAAEFSIRCGPRRGPFHCSRVRPIINNTCNTTTTATTANTNTTTTATNNSNATNLTESESSRLEQLSSQLEQLQMQVQALKHQHQQQQQDTSFATSYGRLYRPHFVHPLFYHAAVPSQQHDTVDNTDIAAQVDTTDNVQLDDTVITTSTVVGNDDGTNTGSTDVSEYYVDDASVVNTNGAAVPATQQQQQQDNNEQQSSQYEQQVQALIAMGINDEQARIAMISTNGNIDEAIEMLFE